MASVCIDIFSIEPVTWLGHPFDSVIICVDRHSGWIIAKPCTKEGLTAERAAHLMLDGGWDIFGVPSVMTSDQGTQFAGQWWRTICARLGVREAFSQAHRPQANGRAEAAGKQLVTLLRKLNAEEGINWVEALPRALHMHHYKLGISGLNTHQIFWSSAQPGGFAI